MSDTIGLQGAEVLAGIAVQISADDSKLKQDFSRIKNDLEAQGRALALRLPTIIESSQVRAQLETAIRTASVGLAIRIPILLDSGGISTQLAMLGGGGGGGGAWTMGGGFAGGGSRWVNSRVIATNPPGGGGAGEGGGLVYVGSGGGGGGGGGDEAVAAAGGGGLGGGAGAGVRGSRRFGRLIGAGFIAHVGASLLTAEREYNINSFLAANDQRAQLDATLTYRQGIINSGAFIGQTIGFLQDPSGMDEAAVRSALASSSAQDARTAAMVGAADKRRQFGNRAAMAGQRDPFERELLTLKQQHDDVLAEIDKERLGISQADQLLIENTKKDLATSRGQRVRARQVAHGEFGSMEEQNAFVANTESQLTSEDAASITSLRSDLSGRAKRRIEDRTRDENTRYDAEVFETRRNRLFDQAATGVEVAGSARTAGFRAANDPYSAARSQVITDTLVSVIRDIGQRKPLAVIGAALSTGGGELTTINADQLREVSATNLSLDTEAGVTGAIRRRDPLGAQLRRLRGDRALRLQQSDARNDPAIAAKIGSNFDDEEMLAGEEYLRSQGARSSLAYARAGANRDLIARRPLAARLRLMQTESNLRIGADPSQRDAIIGETDAQRDLLLTENARDLANQRIVLGARQSAAELAMNKSIDRSTAGDLAQMQALIARGQIELNNSPAELVGEKRTTLKAELAALREDLVGVHGGGIGVAVDPTARIVGDPLGIRGDARRMQLVDRKRREGDDAFDKAGAQSAAQDSGNLKKAADTLVNILKAITNFMNAGARA